MTKKEFAKRISAQCGVGIGETELVLSSFGEVLSNVLAEGESVFLRGFGTFKTVIRKEKKARNISAGTIITIPEHNAPVVKFCEEIIERVR